MTGLVIGLAIGAFLLLIAPSLIPVKYRYAGLNSTIRLAGIVVIGMSVVLTSFVWVPDGRIGTLFRVYGGKSLAQDHIVAREGENGPQADVLPPGFHFWPLVNVMYDVSTSVQETKIGQGEVGILSARDGESLRAGQAFADPFSPEMGNNMLDAGKFLANKGQRGPQLSILTPGKYRLNPYLWEVRALPAIEMKAGFVGVVKSNVHAAIDFGTLKAEKPADCTPTSNRKANSQNLDAPTVPVGCIGIWEKSLQPGMYYFNREAFTLTEIDTRAQVWTYAGGYTRANISLTVDAKGEIVQTRTEDDIKFDSAKNADAAIFVKMEGWDVPLELRVVAQVSPNEASCVVAGVGTLEDIENRVLTPSIRAIMRDVAGGSYQVTEPKLDDAGKPVLDANGQPIVVTINRPTRVLDLINQRPLIEGEVERRIQPEGEKACVTIREVRLGEPAIPPELLVAVRREQLATQLAKAFIQERGAQETRIASEKAKATADQQSTLVAAEINVQRSVQNAVAARNEGQGERDKLAAIADGQKVQMNVLGVDATVKLRQFELVLEKLFGFANAHPDVIKAGFENAQKFVPNQVTTMGGGSSNPLAEAAALFGTFTNPGAVAKK